MDSRWTGRSDRQHPNLPTTLKFVAALLCALLWNPLTCLGATPREFHIAQGDATLTLNEFSRQANLQLLFDFIIVRGRITQAIDGHFEPGDALRLMLDKTGLVFDFVNERTLAVTPLKVASATGSAAPQDSTALTHVPRTQSTQWVSRGPGSAEPAPDPFASIETIRVTGTHFPGETAVGAEMLSFDHQKIEDSGASTVGDFLHTLSQVFGGGPTQDTHLGVEAQSNSAYGTGINLRGLGARATLVLINGRRLAPGGSGALFVDIDNIPLTAIERIDVLPDSASALYGADAVGGVVNFIMRENFSGAETIVNSGRGSDGTLKNDLVSQTIGHKWDTASASATLEYYHRDALAASDRKYAVSNLTPFGGADYDVMTGNPGTLIVGGQTYAIPAGQDGTHLSLSSLTPGTVNLQNRFLQDDLTPEQQRLSLFASGRQNFADSLSLYTDVFLSDRRAKALSSGISGAVGVPASNPFNPTGGLAPVAVQYNFADDLGPSTTVATVKTSNVTVGADYDFTPAWATHAYVSYARERQVQVNGGLVDFTALQAALADPNPATAFNPFGDGSHTNPETLQSLISPWEFRANSELKVADVTVDGTLLKLRGGDLKLAAGVDRRDEFFSTLTPASILQAELFTNLSRQTSAAFSELVIPLFGKANARPGLRKLEFSAAARYEDYSGFGHATSPKFGLAWSPFDTLAFRGSWSRSLRAPALYDLDESQNTVVAVPLANPASPTGSTLALLWSGRNAQLREERAKSWTAGFDFRPERVKGLAFGVTWFDIKFDDRIETTLFSPDVLSNPLYAGLVTTSPDAAQVNYVCSHSLVLLGSAGTCEQLGAGAIVDLRTHNVETLTTRGIDFTSEYERDAFRGKLKFTLDGTYLFDYSLGEVSGAPVTSVLNTPRNPINLRLRTSASWLGRRFGWSAAVNYANSYRDTVSQPNMPVAAWTTVDARIEWRLDPGGGGGGWLDNTKLELNASNVFNRDPPFLNNGLAGLGYDEENGDPYGRLVSLQVRKSW